jgi:hypothetical protein
MLTPGDVGRRRFVRQDSEHGFEIHLSQCTQNESFSHYWHQSRTAWNGLTHCQSAQRKLDRFPRPGSRGLTTLRNALKASRSRTRFGQCPVCLRCETLVGVFEVRW